MKHKAELVKVNLSKHPDADTLSIIPILGWTYVGKTESWQNVEYGVWFEPDTLVDVSLPEFSEASLVKDAKYDKDGNHGGTFTRIKAKKLRGVVSYGYMIPAKPEDVSNPEELFEKYQCAHWNPPEPGSSGSKGVKSSNEVASPPKTYFVKYDVDNFQRYASQVFTEGEPVFVTEKIHGANARYVYSNGEFHCGSRTEWKKEFASPPNVDAIIEQMRAKAVSEDKIEQVKNKFNNWNPERNIWWKALRQYPALMEFLEKHPDTVVYGELYGSVQDMKYGVPPGEVRLAIFDILAGGNWVNPHFARYIGCDLPWVPTVADSIPYDFNKLVQLAEMDSIVPGANHFAEGVVVSPILERNDPRLGRVKLKIVSSRYLEKGK